MAKKGNYSGQIADNEQYADPMRDVPEPVVGLGGTYNDIGEKSGFQTDGFLDKGDTPYGEAAKFNYMPPGEEIENQHMAKIHPMPLRKVTEESYPMDGWEPKPKVVVD